MVKWLPQPFNHLTIQTIQPFNHLIMRFLFTALSFLFLSVFAFSQKSPPRPMKFGKISEADIKMKYYEADSSAEAVVLCDYGQVMVHRVPGETPLHFEHHRRVKILKKSGFKYGDVALPYYSYGHKESFYFGDAMITLPDGKQIKLDKKDVFTEKINEYWSQAKFTFPQLEEGCIIEYNYFINSDFYTELKEWYFQEEIPVRHSEYRIDFPRAYEYIFLFQGNEGMELISDEKGKQIYAGKNGRFINDHGIFILENAPAMKEESFITTMDDYRARIRFQLSEVNYSDGRKIKFLDSWQNAKKQLKDQEYFYKQYNKKFNYKKIIESTEQQINLLNTEKEKAEFIYQHISRKIKWNGHHSMFTSRRKLQEAYELGSGNSAEINLSVLALLRQAGIEAQPVLTSTRSHGKMYEEYPFMDQFNHVLIQAKIDGKEQWLDATDPLRPLGYPEQEALNGRGWHMEKGWINIQPPKMSASVFVVKMKLASDGSLEGSQTAAFTGYEAIPERRDYARDKNGKHWQERFSGKYPDAEIKNIRKGKLENISSRFFDTINFFVPNAAMTAGDLIYLQPVIYSSFSDNPFTLDERNYPVDIPYAFREQHVIELAVPEAYKIEEMPENVKYVLPDNGGAFKYILTKKNEHTLSLVILLKISQLKYYPNEYFAIKELFDLFIEKIGEQIVLKKRE
ncbi:MAG TPA: DUF3857 domain-containing protein [Bacteroidetes bacterium]|nr:DUF3857 domain-containing protein [Bacteroidota bacterium]